MRNAAAALTACAILSCLGGMAWASCAKDLARIQLALPKAAPEVQSRVDALVPEPQAKAKDRAGCDAVTRQALQLLRLPPLPPPRVRPDASGACTVHVDGVATRSCIAPETEKDGQNISSELLAPTAFSSVK